MGWWSEIKVRALALFGRKRMEDELDEVAAGNLNWDSLVSGFYLGEDFVIRFFREISQSPDFIVLQAARITALSQISEA